MRLSFADAGLAALDGLEGVDAACLFVFEDARPLKGLAGYIDWRLCGGLSRILEDGRFVGAREDALLFPADGRLPFGRIFCYGAGKRAALGASQLGSLTKRACEAMSMAGARSFATELPAVAGLDEDGRAQAFIAEGAAFFKGERIVVFGEGRALAQAFGRAAGRMKGLQVDSEPLGATVTVVAHATAAPAKPVATKTARR